MSDANSITIDEKGLATAAKEIAAGNSQKALAALTGLLVATFLGPIPGAIAAGLVERAAVRLRNNATARFVAEGKRIADEQSRAQAIAEYLRPLLTDASLERLRAELETASDERQELFVQTVRVLREIQEHLNKGFHQHSEELKSIYDLLLQLLAQNPSSPSRLEEWLAEYTTHFLLELRRALSERVQLDSDWPIKAHVMTIGSDGTPLVRVHRFLAGVPDSPALTPMNFLEHVQNGDTVLYAPAGSGKTSFLLRVAQHSAGHMFVPFYFDLAKLKPDPSIEIDMIATALMSARRESTEMLHCALQNERTRVILILDGLNENTFYSADDVLDHFLGLRQLGPGNTLIVGDRMVPRKPYEQKFRAATMASFDADFLRGLMTATDGNPTRLGRFIGSEFDAWQPLLESPFFLDLAMTLANVNTSAATGTPSRYQLLEAYFAKQFVPDDMEPERRLEDFAVNRLPRLAIGALNWYREGGGVLIDKARALELLGIPSNAAGLLSEVADNVGSVKLVRFKHQLFHDFLVGAWLAGVNGEAAENRWRFESLNTATLFKSGYDSLELAAEGLAQRGNATDQSATMYLTEVYDWDYRATLRILSRLARLGASDVVAPQARLAIRLVNNEKRWDPFEHTRTEILNELKGMATDSALHPGMPDDPWLSFRDVDDLVHFCESHPLFNVPNGEALSHVRYWREWRDLFTKGNRASRQDLGLLGRDPLFGWTASNVFRRRECRPNDEGFEYARELYSISRGTSESWSRSAMFRWRLVHLLGVDARLVTISFLTAVAADTGATTRPAENRHVRYGAARSAIESISLLAEETERKRAIDHLAESLKVSLSHDGSTFRHTIGTLVQQGRSLRHAPSSWFEETKPFEGLIQSTIGPQ